MSESLPAELVRHLLTFSPDLAFAASSIITRDVMGSDFKYAKIMTMDFFGAGVVEIPPEGYKKAKNSKKMQMVFFVHQGKVLVEIGAVGMEVSRFAISKGGAWIVPRGKSPTCFPSHHSPKPIHLPTAGTTRTLPRMMSGLESVPFRLGRLFRRQPRPASARALLCSALAASTKR